MAAKFGEFEGKDIDDLDHSNKQIFSLLTISLFMSYLMLIVIGGIVGASTVMFNFITLIVFSKFIKKKNIDDVLSKSWKIVDWYSIFFLKFSPFFTIISIILIISKLI